MAADSRTIVQTPRSSISVNFVELRLQAALQRTQEQEPSGLGKFSDTSDLAQSAGLLAPSD